MEIRVLDDHRFFTLSELDQLIYLKLLALSKKTGNQIPKTQGVLKALLRTDRSESEIESALDRIRCNFPKFKQNKYFHYFQGWSERFPKKGNKECTDLDLDIDLDKDLDIEPSQGTNVTTVRNHFYSVYKEKLGVAYMADFAKDGAIFKKILTVVAEEKVLALIDRFFKEEDDFVRKAGFTVGVFKTQVNKLLQGDKPKGRAEEFNEKLRLMK